MVDLRLPAVPADLKHVLPFLQRAQEVHARDPCVCYWSMYYVAQLGMKRPQTKDNKPFLAAVVDQLEGMKRSMRGRRQITDEAAGSSHVRRFGFNVFEAANNEDIQGNASRSTAKKFLAASYFLEILRLFGPLDVEVEETIKYAKFKAADIVRSLREGVTPTPGIPAVPTRYATNGHALTPSNLSPQTNPILLSSRPSTLQSPAESPTTGAPRSRIPQPNYPPAPTESGSGSAPVSPRNTPVKTSVPLDSTRRESIKAESIALPTSGSSGDIPLPENSSPKKRQSPIPRTRSPLAALSFHVSPKATPVNKSRLLPTAARLASPVKVLQEVSIAPAPVIQQLSPQLPPTSPSYQQAWPQPGTVSPTMSSTMTIDSTDTFTSSQLQTVIQSGPVPSFAAPRAQSPAKAESTASTELTESQSYASEETGTEMMDSPLMPVLTVVDDLVAAKLEVNIGSEGARRSSLVTITSPVMDDWDLGREVTQAIRQLTPPAPPFARASSTEYSPLSLARATPIPESPEAALLSTPTQTPAPKPLSLVMGESMVHPEPTVVIPRSPTQPSPTSNISPNSPSTISPVSLDMALAQNQSFKSAAELIDAELWKVYGKLDVPTQESGADEGIDVEVESGSSVTSGSSGSSLSGSEEESNQDETPAGSSDEESDGQSVVSAVKILATEISVQANGQSVRRSSGFELKSLIKTSKTGEANGGAQFEAIVRRKTVRFAPSVVGGLSPEVIKQILPPMTPGARTSPPLPIIPSSVVVHASQPLVRPKSLTIRSSVEYDHQQPSSMSPNSPTYMSGPQYASSGLVGLPPLAEGRPQEDFAIIPFHPSMSASHPAPAVQNNPAFVLPSKAVVRASWGSSSSSPPQQPTQPYRRHSAVDRETAALAQKYSRFAISSLNYLDVEAAKKELRAALALLEGETN